MEQEGCILMRDMKDMWDFPVMEGVFFEKANRVHPLMQARVENLIHQISKDPNVKRVVLFGSSLEFHCNSNSDIDLYIEKYKKDKKLQPLSDVGCEVDIITDLPLHSARYCEIEKTGLLLFER